jgi:hypothetical protein
MKIVLYLYVCTLIALLKTAHILHVSGHVKSGLLTHTQEVKFLYTRKRTNIQTFAVMLLLLLLVSEFIMCIP